MWLECKEFADIDFRVHLCPRHAFHVHTTVQQHLTQSDERSAAQQQWEAEAEAITAAKVDAGEELARSDIAPGWIYYLQIDEKTIKIGYSKDVTARMRQYAPTVKLLAVEPGTPKLERARHSLFHAHLSHGREWFQDAPELQAWIAGVLAKHGDPSDWAYTYTTPQTSRQVTAPRGYRGVKRTAA